MSRGQKGRGRWCLQGDSGIGCDKTVCKFKSLQGKRKKHSANNADECDEREWGQKIPCGLPRGILFL